MKNFFKNVIKWLKTLISNSDDADEKRVISLLSFVVLVGMVVLNANGIIIDPKLIYVFASLCGGSSILTVINDYRK